MNRPIVLAAILTALIFGAGELAASSLYREELIQISPGVSTYQLSAGRVINASEKVASGSGELLRESDYDIDYRSGRLILLKETSTEFVFISYMLIPPKLTEPRFLYQVRAETDSLFQNIQPTRRENWWQDDGRLLISGSKTFSVSFSDESAFNLKQSLYVNLSGELADGVNITAQLSDSQSKLSPEGDSRELSSLDQVFMKVHGKSWELAMGDLELKYEGSRYLDYYTRFEGVSGRIGKTDYLQAAYSVGGGKNSRVDISVIDGKQGPYYLNPGGQPGSMIVIAGSESVYLNGELLERGSDYFIDYSEGSLMFRRMVYSTDRIGVWFKYSDEHYPRHSVLSSSSWQPLSGLTFSHRIITASDSKNNPLLYDFTEEDLDSLRLAGDNDAWGAGATLVEPGQGTYRLITSPGGITYFQLAEADSLADYVVIFSYVGPGKGDYEQYSSGKFRYLGIGLGEWLPQKRLIAPTATVNTAFRASWDIGNWTIGTEGILTSSDANTLSRLDDADNDGGYLFTWLRFQNSKSRLRPSLSAEYEKRWANTLLLSDFSSQTADHELGTSLPADSLALDSFSLRLGANLDGVVRPEITLRHQYSQGVFEQDLLRISSSTPAWKLLPRLEIRSTLAKTVSQTNSQSSGNNSYQYLDGSWKLSWLKLGGLVNQQSFDSDAEEGTDTSFLRLNPYTELGNSKSLQTRVALIADTNEIVSSHYSNRQRSHTWSYRQLINTADHNINLVYSHRRLSSDPDSSRSSYDLINLRANDSFLKRAIVLLTNYQLNQTEFFPRIRELQYIGNGLGVYDSTGVAVPNGDWDYVYITSSTGTLSSERGAQMSLYLKPGNLSTNNIVRRISSDIMVNLTEQQSGQAPDPLSYLFWPGTVFEDSLTIYGKQNYQQNLWIELVRNKVNAQLSLEYERSLDNRYQDKNRNLRSTLAAKIDFNRIGDYSFSVTAQNRNESESRYRSQLENNSLQCFAQRNLGRSSTLKLELLLFDESGSSTIGSDSYRLYGVGLTPGFRSVWGPKGRISANLNLQYNEREGDDLLSFLPEKRSGAIIGLNLNGIYRLNAFSTASLDYTANSYPGEKLSHQLKLEFKAEL